MFPGRRWLSRWLNDKKESAMWWWKSIRGTRENQPKSPKRGARLTRRWLSLRVGSAGSRHVCLLRCLFQHDCWVHLWRCFLERLVFELVDWVKQTAFPNVGRHHPTYWGPEWSTKVGEVWIGSVCLTAWVETSVFCAWADLYHKNSCSQALGLGLEMYTTGFPGSPACRWHIVELLCLPNHVSQ